MSTDKERLVAELQEELRLLYLRYSDLLISHSRLEAEIQSLRLELLHISTLYPGLRK